MQGFDMALDPVKNFAIVTISTGYAAGALSVALQSGEGAKLPNPAVDGAFNLVWWNFTDYWNPSLDPNVEIVRCTARVSDTLTITRAQEGTTAAAHNTAGKSYRMILGLTAKMIIDIASEFALTGHTHATNGISDLSKGHGTAAPISGSYNTGDLWMNDNAAAGGFLAWIYISGTGWKPFLPISA
jgi:hypothetical protein